MKVRFADLSITNNQEINELKLLFDNFLRNGMFIGGKNVTNFENNIAKFTGSKYCVGLGSGTSALYLSLKSLGIGPGDEVITTPLSWVVTTNAIVLTGAKPVFADINDDLNINPDKIENLITKKTKAIVPMHTSGHMCNMKQIQKIAKKYKLSIVEDAAQAFCAKLNGVHAGRFSKVASLSMNPMKMLGGFGESGAIITDSEEIYNKIKILRHAGISSKRKKFSYNNSLEPSLNHKIDNLQSLLLNFRLKKIKKIHKRRNNIARIYDEELKGIVELQTYHKNEIHGRYLYTIKSSNRDKLSNYLNDNNIETKVYYQPLCCDIYYLKNNYKNIHIPNARKQVKRFLSIPLHEKLNNNQIEFVINKIKKFFR